MPEPTRQILENTFSQMREGLHRSLSRRLADPDLAEDVLQDVFLKIHQSADQLEDVDRVKGWIHRIAHNATLDAIRRRRPEAELPEEIEDEGAADDSLRVAVEGALREMLSQLGPEDREALTLTEFDGKTQKQLAEHLGISVSGAKSRVQRARRRLRSLLLDCCHFELDAVGRVMDMVPRRGACDCGCE